MAPSDPPQSRPRPTTDPFTVPEDYAAPSPPPDEPTEAAAQAPATPAPTPLLELRDGLGSVIDIETDLAEVAERLAAGTGPVAIDAERASGYRYSARAYLIQLRREGAGTALIDPIPIASLAPLHRALGGTEWILHAATQDLPCLAEVGLRPSSLFDTELAGRLLGYPKVGLATLVETLLGRRLRKEHSAVDWSTRPLPRSWLEYAALDVEVLTELREMLAAELVAKGKADWAEQEFAHLLDHQAPVRIDPWRRTSGIQRLRGRRALAAVRALWEARDALARERDVTPSRLIPDSAIVAAAQAMPEGRRALLATEGFHGRGAQRYAARWVDALEAARALDEDELPGRAPRTSGPPAARLWADRDPEAARRLAHARTAMSELSEQIEVPVENILTPDYLRRVLWTPPPAEAGALADAVADQLAGYGARPWQIELTTPIVVDAVIAARESAP